MRMQCFDVLQGHVCTQSSALPLACARCWRVRIFACVCVCVCFYSHTTPAGRDLGWIRGALLLRDIAMRAKDNSKI